MSLKYQIRFNQASAGIKTAEKANNNRLSAFWIQEREEDGDDIAVKALQIWRCKVFWIPACAGMTDRQHSIVIPAQAGIQLGFWVWRRNDKNTLLENLHLTFADNFYIQTLNTI